MKSRAVLLLLSLALVACGASSSSILPVSEMPDPAIYTLTLSELPDVGLAWQQNDSFMRVEEASKWAYQSYQAYQPGNLGMELESGFAINNDVVIYQQAVGKGDLPQPPAALGDIQNISWKSVPQTRRLGDKSAVWKTTLGDMLVPVWWLEFYQGHAYVRVGILGFPDQIAPAILLGLGDIVATRLPRAVDQLRSDAATRIPTKSPYPPTYTPRPAPVVESTLTPAPQAQVIAPGALLPISYTAPAGEVGMVAFQDESGHQLADGIVGEDDIQADLGSGTAYEWVGWTDATEPVTITFNFEGQVSIAKVEIGLNHREGLGIFVPQKVTINSLSFELAADDVPNNQRKYLSFSGPFSGPTLQVVLYHRGRGWIMVDEVRFLPQE